MKNNLHFSASIPRCAEESKHFPYSVFLAWLESIALRWVNKHEELQAPVQMSWQSLYLNMHFILPLRWSSFLSLSLSVRLVYEWLNASRWLWCRGIRSTRVEAVPAVPVWKEKWGKRRRTERKGAARAVSPPRHCTGASDFRWHLVSLHCWNMSHLNSSVFLETAVTF